VVALFVQMALGDDRAVQATYVAGQLKYSRQEEDELLLA
jgi:guanine deaminase